MKITTPVGELEWIVIDGEGKENLSGKMQYQANIRLPKDSPVVDTINKFWEDNKPKGFKKAPKSTGVYPHKKQVEKGVYEETGDITLRFSTGVTWPNGNPKEIKVYNAKARKITLPERTKIGNGSIGCIAGTMGIYTAKTPKGAVVDAGVTLYLDAVQIKKLVEYNEEPQFEASDDGYEGDENSFQGNEEPAAAPRI